MSGDCQCLADGKGSTLTLVAEPSNYARVCLKMPMKNLGALPASAEAKALAFSGLTQEKGRCKPINSLKVTGESPSSPLITSLH